MENLAQYEKFNEQIMAFFTKPIGIIIILLMYIIFMIIPLWKIFEKAGQKGWKAIIPIYNIYILFKIAWKPSMFYVFIVVEVLQNVIPLFNIKTLILSSIVTVLSIILLVVMVKLSVKVAKSFGKEKGFGIGILFLPIIFLYILALGKSEYVGIEEED